jgi:uncharacterized membrane protein YedE/YeeE
MKRNLTSWLAGIVFGFGLALSGMTHPEKVLGFLDVVGAWDASLLFVLGGAVGVTLLSFRVILRMKKPLLAERFYTTRETQIDRPLIVGAILFGAGWGISGYCPGPAIALIAAPNWELWAFLPAAILGAAARAYFERRSQPVATQQAVVQERRQPKESLASESSCG